MRHIVDSSPHASSTVDRDRTDAAVLRLNNDIYERLVKHIRTMDLAKSSESVLHRIEAAARMASAFHCGRFADGALENVAFEIGVRLDESLGNVSDLGLESRRRPARRRVLHVASHVRSVGGQSRMPYHWVSVDKSSLHSLALIDQGNADIPKWISDAVRSGGGDLVVFPQGAPLRIKAVWLRDMARRFADLVVMHHHPSDVVPTVAFATSECPPVTILNHADHVFWLGSSASDMVINLRTAAVEYNENRRFIEANVVLPIPLNDRKRRSSQEDARRSLGIGSDEIVLLSVGRCEKYWSHGTHDFVRTTGKLLDRVPEAHLYVVGATPESIAPYLSRPIHDRLHFRGIVEDPSVYHMAADLYLESFPFGSQTALLEAALSGLAVVPAYAPLFPLLVTNDDSLTEVLKNEDSEEDYLNAVDCLIRNQHRRLEVGDTLRKRLLRDHVGKGWLDRLSTVYHVTDRLTHNPRPIPVSSCSTTEEDVNLSLFRVNANGRTYASTVGTNEASMMFRHAASVSKYIGDYPAARHYAGRAILTNPHERDSWRLLAISCLGPVGARVAQHFRERRNRVDDARRNTS